MAEVITGADAYRANAPSHHWVSRPRLTSSDVSVYGVKDSLAADARDASRSDAYGRSALRSTADAVIGHKLTLQSEPVYTALGVTSEEAAEWSDMVEAHWETAAESEYCNLDAQRKQTFTGLMRTAYASFYVGGETLGTIEWSLAPNGDKTCVNLIDPERLCDPVEHLARDDRIRMGVERDKFGAPLAYHIREKHPSDALRWSYDVGKWKRVPRYTPWGRPLVIHYHEQDRPDMTRGVSSYTTALLAMRLLNDYVTTELESAAIRATYAAVIQSELDYEQAMQVIGARNANAIADNPILDFTLRMMAQNAEYYRGQDFKFGKSKVAHLLPNEELKMIQSNVGQSQLKDFNSVNLYKIASALGVDYATLTKDYSSTNYSGARAALYDVWRSYEVRRAGFLNAVARPIYSAWLEEQIAFSKKIPMLGKRSFYEVRDAICRATFQSWGKPRLDPLKENQADLAFFNAGALSLAEICGQDGRDWRRVLRQRAREKDEMEVLGLQPEDINPAIHMNKGKDAHSSSSKDGASEEGD